MIEMISLIILLIDMVALLTNVQWFIRLFSMINASIISCFLLSGLAAVCDIFLVELSLVILPPVHHDGAGKCV